MEVGRSGYVVGLGIGMSPGYNVLETISIYAYLCVSFMMDRLCFSYSY